jgi:hypothetical protein
MKIRRLRNLKVVFMVSTFLLLGWKASCSAENAFHEIFKDAFYGGLAGFVTGAVIIALTKKPADHLEYLAYGVGAGAAAGGAFGFMKTRSSGSLVEIENGRMKLGVPAIIPDFRDKTAKGKQVVVTAEIISGKF